MMDGSRFDDLLRSLTGCRRAFLGGALAATAGRLSVRDVDARRRRKRKKHKHNTPTAKPKAKPNAYGCLEVGDACKNAEECCSGTCAGKQGRKRCRAHGTGTCNHGTPGFCSAAEPAQALCNDSLSCVCLETTGGSTFCGSLADRVSGCADCRKDADCLALGLPPGSACVPFATGACAETCESGMVCVAPCETAPAASG